ncbi:MAG: hypothetical protein CMJ25_24610 [Phycisphaerae bacterium]|nr:hypothetical protein [Phycisphaerae bacterium]|tara:strand:- start:42 stop:320 length:279 start_codon:yes stop_codon:yes gene_type:complete
MQKYVNGVLTDMIADEISARQAEESAWDAGANDRAAADNREKRNQLIAETDYFALTDVTLSAEMTTYRQALRNITSHSNWPNLSDSDWPTKP